MSRRDDHIAITMPPEEWVNFLLGRWQSRLVRRISRHHPQLGNILHTIESQLSRHSYAAISITMLALVLIFLLSGKIFEWGWDIDFPTDEHDKSPDDATTDAIALMIIIFLSGFGLMLGCTKLLRLYNPWQQREDRFAHYFDILSTEYAGQYHPIVRPAPELYNDCEVWKRFISFHSAVIADLLHGRGTRFNDSEEDWLCYAEAVALMFVDMERHFPHRSHRDIVEVAPAIAAKPERQSIRMMTLDGDAQQDLVDDADRRHRIIRGLQRQAGLEDDALLEAPRSLSHSTVQLERVDNIARPAGFQRASVKEAFNTLKPRENPVVARLRRRDAHAGAVATPLAAVVADQVRIEPAPRQDRSAVTHPSRSPRPARQALLADPWDLPLWSGGDHLWLHVFEQDRITHKRYRLTGYCSAEDVERNYAHNNPNVCRGYNKIAAELSYCGNVTARIGAQIFRQLRLSHYVNGKPIVSKPEFRLKQILKRMSDVHPHAAGFPSEPLAHVLFSRAISLTALLKGADHLDRWEYFICNDPFNNKAFSLLKSQDQVRLIYTLLSGPDCAKLTAISLVHNKKFLETYFAKFIVAFMDFSKTLCQVIDADQLALRQRLLLEHLNILTDGALGRTVYRRGYVRDFCHDHPAIVEQICTVFRTLVDISTLDLARSAVHAFSEEDELMILHGASAKEDYMLIEDEDADPEQRSVAKERDKARRRQQHRMLLRAHYHAQQRASELHVGNTVPGAMPSPYMCGFEVINIMDYIDNHEEHHNVDIKSLLRPEAYTRDENRERVWQELMLMLAKDQSFLEYVTIVLSKHMHIHTSDIKYHHHLIRFINQSMHNLGSLYFITAFIDACDPDMHKVHINALISQGFFDYAIGACQLTTRVQQYSQYGSVSIAAVDRKRIKVVSRVLLKMLIAEQELGNEAVGLTIAKELVSANHGQPYLLMRMISRAMVKHADNDDAITICLRLLHAYDQSVQASLPAYVTRHDDAIFKAPVLKKYFYTFLEEAFPLSNTAIKVRSLLAQGNHEEWWQSTQVRPQETDYTPEDFSELWLCFKAGYRTLTLFAAHFNRPYPGELRLPPVSVLSWFYKLTGRGFAIAQTLEGARRIELFEITQALVSGYLFYYNEQPYTRHLTPQFNQALQPSIGLMLVSLISYGLRTLPVGPYDEELQYIHTADCQALIARYCHVLIAGQLAKGTFESVAFDVMPKLIARLKQDATGSIDQRQEDALLVSLCTKLGLKGGNTVLFKQRLALAYICYCYKSFIFKKPSIFRLPGLSQDRTSEQVDETLLTICSALEIELSASLISALNITEVVARWLEKLIARNCADMHADLNIEHNIYVDEETLPLWH